MVVTGDPDQSDLLDSSVSGNRAAARPDADIAVVWLGDRDIVRHPLVADMLTVL
jgi:phosphate starvation-inducible PhoH-like protein